MGNIEDTIHDHSLPSNSMAILDRLKEVIRENQTNSLECCRDDVRVRKLMWLLNSQVYGQLAEIDMHGEWQSLQP